MKPDIYQVDKKFCYVDPNDLSEEDVLVNPETNATLALAKADTVKIDGVYCVNQGTATFRYIDILFADNEYTIVKSNVNYSIAWYDRIVLNQAIVTENQIIK